MEYLNNMYHIYKIIEEHSPYKKCKRLIAFDDMIGDMPSNKKPNPIVTEEFIRGRKVSTQSYFSVPKNIRLNSTYYLIMKNPNKWKFQKVLFNHLSET